MPQLQRDDLAMIVVYCRGGDCEDSLNLAHEIVYRKEIDLELVNVYEGGLLDWVERGGPLVGGVERDGPPVEPSSWIDPEFEDPEGDAAPAASAEPMVLTIGLAALLGLACLPTLRHRFGPLLAIAGGVVLGAYAWVKLGAPADFLKAVHGYGVLPTDPPWLLNLAGAGVPWMEATAALCMISGVLRRGAAAVLSLFLVVFTIAILARAGAEAGGGMLTYEFDCGCGTGMVVVWEKVLSNLALLAVLLLSVRRRATG